jgi:MoxR-like ATPase
VVKLAQQVIKQGRQDNLHFFVNSVKFINSVIKKAELLPEQVKIVCANSDENIQKLGKEYQIEIPSDPIKKVNFYTSTAFEGCDIFDKEGRIYIVSDGRIGKEHTLIDISTLFIQICGRIRNSIYNAEITHIYSTTRYSEDLTLEEFKENTKQNLNKAVKLADEINQVSEGSREIMFSKIKYMNEKYVRIENNRLIVDKNFANIDIVNFKITKQVYKTGVTLCDELMKNGFNISVAIDTPESAAEKVEMNPKAKVSFKDLFEEYVRIKEMPMILTLENLHYKLVVIEKANPLIKEAFDKLGKEKVAELKYVQTNIKRELLKQLDISNEYKIVKMIKECIAPHIALPIVTIKTKLQEIYNTVGIEKKAKATDLKYWFVIKGTTKNIKGRNTACIMIVSDKFVRTE